MVKILKRQHPRRHKNADFLPTPQSHPKSQTTDSCPEFPHSSAVPNGKNKRSFFSQSSANLDLINDSDNSASTGSPGRFGFRGFNNSRSVLDLSGVSRSDYVDDSIDITESARHFFQLKSQEHLLLDLLQITLRNTIFRILKTSATLSRMPPLESYLVRSTLKLPTSIYRNSLRSTTRLP